MAIRFQCSECGAGFKAGDSQGGVELPCPKCGANIRVPSFDTPPSTPPANAAPRSDEAQLAPPDDPLDETESFGFGDTQVNPFVGLGQEKTPPPPPPPPPAPAPAANAFQSPQAPIERPRDVSLTDVRIVDIDLRFGTIFKLLLKVWIVSLAFGLAAWVLMFVLLMLFGIAFGGGWMSNAPIGP